MSLSRRQFLEDSMLAAAAAATATVGSKRAFTEETSPSAGEKLTVAIIGCGIRGKAHAGVLSLFPDVDVAYVCDPDSRRTAEVAKQIVAAGRPAPKQVPDLRTINDDKSVDAVFICTCNHWHALAAIWAMQAGKHAYVEKPVSHNIHEGRVMVEVARQTGRICQGGTQNRSRGDMVAPCRSPIGPRFDYQASVWRRRQTPDASGRPKPRRQAFCPVLCTCRD